MTQPFKRTLRLADSVIRHDHTIMYFRLTYYTSTHKQTSKSPKMFAFDFFKKTLSLAFIDINKPKRLVYNHGACGCVLVNVNERDLHTDWWRVGVGGGLW